MSKRKQAQADKANAKLVRARTLLTEASFIAESLEDYYAAGAIDTVSHAIAGIDVSAEEQR